MERLLGEISWTGVQFPPPPEFLRSKILELTAERSLKPRPRSRCASAQRHLHHISAGEAFEDDDLEVERYQYEDSKLILIEGK